MQHKTVLLAVFFLAPLAGLFAQSYTQQAMSLPRLNKKFTIVAHIFRDSLGEYNIQEQAIAEAIDSVNHFFAPIGVSFEVCEFRKHDNHQHDILDESKEAEQIVTKYHVEYRINMYFLREFPEACGFATLAGIAEPLRSMVFIKKGDCTNPRVIAHELGHFFGLKHTFEGSGDELVDGSNCTTAGDGICDTPADPYVDKEPLSNYVADCEFINTKRDLNQDYYNPDLGNIMSYYECDTCGFSAGQLKKMAETYMMSGIKFW